METATRLQSDQPTERALSGLAHASAVLPFACLIAPILIWAARRDRSPYVAFQTLQAVVIQGMMAAITAGGLILYTLGFFLIFAVPPQTGEAVIIASSILLIAIFAVDLGLVLYSLVAAVLTLRGKNFRYLWVASIVDSIERKKNQE